MEPSQLDKEFKEHKNVALQYFVTSGKDYGNSFKDNKAELEDIINKEFPHYKSTIEEGLKGNAYQSALEAYTKKFEEKYETYHDPEDEPDTHDEAWEEALTAYKMKGVGNMPMTECQTIKLMREKRKEFRQLNKQKRARNKGGGGIGGSDDPPQNREFCSTRPTQNTTNDIGRPVLFDLSQSVPVESVAIGFRINRE
ncbi:uncharacterized protein LOC117107290 [Anneissia japonica]|uniref:uncharacterized protein LOC117107290 n=1 Tax=Anneissia japonica TaxID=1529436 RepID=UPI00142599B8|nr:uncharacterized protein LOC117107290 [Anneissia japonica]